MSIETLMKGPVFVETIEKEKSNGKRKMRKTKGPSEANAFTEKDKQCKIIDTKADLIARKVLVAL